MTSFPPCFFSSRIRRGASVHAGFSLVEVALALGIVVFAILPMVMLLPTGLTTLGEARDQITETHILNGLSANVRAMSFSDLGTLNEEKSFFDLTGKQISKEEDAIYQTEVSAINPTYSGNPTGAERSLLAVRVEITHLRRANSTPNIYTIHVAKSR